MTSKYIDLENRKIIGKSGKVYNIAPEDISVGRWAEFEIRSITIAYNTDFETLLNTFRSIKDILMNGKNNAQGNAYHAIKEIDEFEKGLINYQLNHRPKLVEFISLFTTAEGEDKSLHSEEIIREKYNDWSHIPIADFFFLAAKVIPSFSDYLVNTTKQAANENTIIGTLPT